MSRPPLPPFTAETAAQKARMAEDAWNTRDPARVALAYTTDSRWRNRAEFLEGRAAIEAFLTRKWNRELDYRLIKEVWTFRDNRIAVRFAYEWHDDSGHWFRSYGNDNWEFDEQGLMRLRIASINDLPSTQASASITGRSAAARTTTRRSASSGYSGDETFRLSRAREMYRTRQSDSGCGRRDQNRRSRRYRS
jgi:nuclear transport factor 2 (NTF2) superfamily protein